VVFIDKAFLHHAWIQDWYGWRGYKTGTDELLVSSEDKMRSGLQMWALPH